MIQRYQEEFANLPKPVTKWLASVKQSAMDRFVKSGFPTTKLEAWKDTNLSVITEKYFSTTLTKDSYLEPKITFWKSFPHVVFHNGNLVEVVTKESLAIIKPLDTALDSSSDVFQSVFNLQPKSPHAFYDLNTSMVQQGVGIHVPKNEVLREPIYLVYISDDDQKAHYYRNLIVLEQGAEATVVELYIQGSKPSSSLTVPVTQIKVAQNSKLRHAKYQNESELSSHTGLILASQSSNSSLKTHSFSFGGRLTRNDIQIGLDEQGAECLMDGLYVASGKQTVDHHTMVVHAKPHCISSETYKGILFGQSHGIFEGKIKVELDAQKTDAKQMNQNLLMSPDAQIHTNPQLEILADDVKCAHGATIGKLDENQIFYMRSRGIDVKTARDILLQSYANEVISNVNIPELILEIQHALNEKIQS